MDMLQAMNTGHEGFSLTTVHTIRTGRDIAPEVMVSMANSNMQLISIRQQIAQRVHCCSATALATASREGRITE